MRKGLFLGLNEYDHVGRLNGCANDAQQMYSVLSRHADGRPNFNSRVFVSPEDNLSKSFIMENVKELFKGDLEVALFYFAGHGFFDEDINTGFIIPQNYSQEEDNGIRIDDILEIARKNPKIQNTIIILDCCQSGSAGKSSILKGGSSILDEGLTILTACKENEYAVEDGKGHGLFTKLMLEALHGGAGNILGKITPSSVYAFVDNALDAWEQRPVFKTNVSQFLSLRDITPRVPLEVLRNLPKWFPNSGSEYRLNPSYEPTSDEADENNMEIFRQLQLCNRHSLIEPVDAEHMYFAAMNSTACRLTVIGEYYRDLAEKGRF
ncbi:caspase family protein [Actinobacillus equuli subsp. haemolyticus]|uniref:caspase family protein n=1 Tax=Actinobacillus equuli TaxID=718 RepID=UPI002441B206|nr:caspase family protein [Actinobacillus equuli]WGE64075.1 caspase family protein [Actinobacillus equuli subsp. haemolyticus]